LPLEGSIRIDSVQIAILTPGVYRSV